MPDKNEPSSIEVRVKRRGELYAWELHRSGSAKAWKSSVFIYESENAARNAGSRALSIILGRIERKTMRMRKVVRDYSGGHPKARSGPGGRLCKDSVNRAPV
jgi:hypothetical protein